MHNDNLVSLLSNKEKTAHYLCRNSLKTPKQAWTELKPWIYWSLPTVIYANCVLAVLWTWSHLWPAAIEMCLFNRQIKFMASFSTTRLPLRFQEEEYDPSIVSVGAGSPLSLSLPLSFLSISPSPAVLHRPQQLSLSFCTLTRLASSPSLHLFSSPLISSRPPLFKVSAQALSQVLEGRNLAWFFRPVCWLCCGNCLLRGTQLCSAMFSSSPDVNTQPRLLLASKKSLKHVAMTTAEPTDLPTGGFCSC